MGWQQWYQSALSTMNGEVEKKMYAPQKMVVRLLMLQAPQPALLQHTIALLLQSVQRLPGPGFTLYMSPVTR